jgi:hypothetical protein
MVHRYGSEDAAIEYWRFGTVPPRGWKPDIQVGPTGLPVRRDRWTTTFDGHVDGADLSQVRKHCSEHPSEEDARNWIYYLPDGIWELSAQIEHQESWVVTRLSQRALRQRRKKGWSSLSKARQAQLIAGGARAGWSTAQVRARYNAGWSLSEIDPSRHGRERLPRAPREGERGHWSRTGRTREVWTVCVAEESEVWEDRTTEEDRKEAVRRRYGGMAKRVLGARERREQGLPEQVPGEFRPHRTGAPLRRGRPR